MAPGGNARGEHALPSIGVKTRRRRLERHTFSPSPIQKSPVEIYRLTPQFDSLTPYLQGLIFAWQSGEPLMHPGPSFNLELAARNG